MNKKVILIISFGSSFKEAREKAIKPVEEAIGSTFFEYDVHRAFTSNHIRRKLRGEGILIESPEEALQRLIVNGYKEIIIQPLHLLAGFEYEKIKNAALAVNKSELSILLGEPLMYEGSNLDEVVEALKSQIPKDLGNKKVVLVGHGTEHPSNNMYQRLEEKLLEQELPILMGTIEAGVEVIIKKLEGKKVSEVLLMPFLLVAGDHVLNDISSDHADSWKSLLSKAGVKVEIYDKGLGENESFQQLYVKRVASIVKKGGMN